MVQFNRQVFKLFDDIISGLNGKMSPKDAQVRINLVDKMLKKSGQYLTACKLSNVVPNMEQFELK